MSDAPDLIAEEEARRRYIPRTHQFRAMDSQPDYCRCGYHRNNVRLHGLGEAKIDELIVTLGSIAKSHDIESGLSLDVCGGELRKAILEWFESFS